MARVESGLHEVFDSLCHAEGHGLANTLRAMARVESVLHEVFDSLCHAESA